MELCDVYLASGEDSFSELLRKISIGRLRTFQLFERMRLRLRLNKLNTETLRKSAPRLWERLRERDAELAEDLAQAILVAHLELIIDVLNLLGIPHQDGFFSKDVNVKSYLAEGWQARAYEACKEKHPPVVLRFYLNHLAVESGAGGELFTPAA
jgi:hypothetical protein